MSDGEVIPRQYRGSQQVYQSKDPGGPLTLAKGSADETLRALSRARSMNPPCFSWRFNMQAMDGWPLATNLAGVAGV